MNTFIMDLLTISVMPWLVSLAVGGSAGYSLALIARRLFSMMPSLYRPAILLPWRTLGVGLVLLIPVVPSLIGLGITISATIVGLFIFIFALPITANIVFEQYHSRSLNVRLVSAARSLALMSVTIATATSAITGTSGPGVIILQGLQRQDQAQFTRGFATVFFVALSFDIALGVLQMLLSPPLKNVRLEQKHH